MKYDYCYTSHLEKMLNNREAKLFEWTCEHFIKRVDFCTLSYCTWSVEVEFHVNFPHFLMARGPIFYLCLLTFKKWCVFPPYVRNFKESPEIVYWKFRMIANPFQWYFCLFFLLFKWNYLLSPLYLQQPIKSEKILVYSNLFV